VRENGRLAPFQDPDKRNTGTLSFVRKREGEVTTWVRATRAGVTRSRHDSGSQEKGRRSCDLPLTRGLTMNYLCSRIAPPSRFPQSRTQPDMRQGDAMQPATVRWITSAYTALSLPHSLFRASPRFSPRIVHRYSQRPYQRVPHADRTRYSTTSSERAEAMRSPR
jgi:hypothetical protein